MNDRISTLRSCVQELAERDWDMPAIQARYNKLLAGGIAKKELAPEALKKNKTQILERVKTRAQEYNLLARNCPQGTALALMEEFGLGNLEIIKALCPFPGIAGTGEICGGITGGLIAIGLVWGEDDMTAYEATGGAIMTGQRFIANFEDAVGHLTCAEIQEKVIFGRNMDPGANEANMAAFGQAKGFEKCGLAPGIGARLAAELIIEKLV